jgi:hypothetical protein
VLEDGTRIYSNYTRYKPRENRVNAVRKPPDSDAVRLGNTWYLPLSLEPLEARSWPETRPDTDAYWHASKPRRCKCKVCRRPEAKWWRSLWHREQRGPVSLTRAQAEALIP